MRKYYSIYTILFTLLALFFTSCQKDIEPGETAVRSMSNEWWLEWDGLPETFFPFSTYNTADNNTTQMWLDDNFTFKTLTGDEQLKGKVNVDLNNLTFSGTDIPNADPNLPITFTVTNGKIIPNGAKGPVSGAVTDSIYFELAFSDEPGTVYKMSGYARTRFAEDDH
jgi:hypothetical protein